MVKVNSNDFVELNYTGKIKITNQVFDLTDKEQAKKLGLFQEGYKYGPRVICVGQKELLAGLDNAILNKEVPSKFTVELKPEEAFGSRNEKLLETVNTDILLKQNINPVPGLQIFVNNMAGTIRSVSKGRTIIDFNHLLAGKELVYDVELKSIVTDNKIKLASLFENAFHLASSEYSITINNNKAEIKLVPGIQFPEQFKSIFENKAKQVFTNLDVKII